APRKRDSVSVIAFINRTSSTNRIRKLRTGSKLNSPVSLQGRLILGGRTAVLYLRFGIGGGISFSPGVTVVGAFAAATLKERRPRATTTSTTPQHHPLPTITIPS